METTLRDLFYGVRMLRKNPGFTIAALLALMLGIASSTAIFTVVNGVLLKPLPYPNEHEIVTLSQTVRSTGISFHDSSPANYIDWASQNDVFAVLAASRGTQVTLNYGDHPERLRMTTASANFFPLFGINPILGRTFGLQDARPGNDHVVVLAYDIWQRLFGGEAEAIGRQIVLKGETFTVIGVMPRGFSPDDYGELWVPSPWDVPPHPLVPEQDPRQMRDRNYLDVWGRLKTGVSLEQARSEMTAIAARLEKQYPNANTDVGVTIVPLHEQLVGGLRSALIVLTVAVAFLLLIGCVNVANLLLSRAATRAREIAIRFALGASRVRLVRQLLTESILLALLGGALGVIFAAWIVPILVSLGPPGLRSFHGIGLNREVLGFSLGISIATGLLFGAMPAFYASFSNPNNSLAGGERGGSGVRSRGRAFLITGEIGLSLVLLIGAGLMMKSFMKLTQVDPGFTPERLLVFNIGPPASTNPSQQTDFYHDVIERLRGLPGVKSVGAVSRLPLAGGNSSRSFTLIGSDKTHDADLRIATSDYFLTMAIPILRGRMFTEQDRTNSQPIVIINEAVARSFFPNEDPVGKFIVLGPENIQRQIVGVVGNVRHVRLERSPNAEIYLPLGQMLWPSMFVAVRTEYSNPLVITPSVQNAVWSVNKDVALASVRSMDDLIANSVADRKFTMLLLATFAGAALVLAAIGLFGVMSYSVAQRVREIGVRMALGAERIDIFKLIVREGMLLTVIGLSLGLAAALAMTRLMAGLLFGVSTIDISTFVSLPILLGLVAFLACWLPARRASSVDPMAALRSE
jgi:putative ABC transport system permease protein